MVNELIFILHCFIVSLLAAVALKYGKLALASLASLYAILANLFVFKQVLLLTLCVTCTDAYSVGSGIILNLTQEYFGPKVARQILYLALAALLIFVILAQIQLYYLPAPSDFSQVAYLNILGQTPRILGASLLSFAISQNLDRVLYSYFQQKFSHRFFILRNYSSLLISQLVDTALFTVLGLAGVFTNLWDIFIFSYLIKIITIIISVPIVSFCKQFLPVTVLSSRNMGNLD
ncbi:MAG TPA: queuosine precursor transporter [Candidatus Babeliales bacterium]|nr:queuosine precursor transporter [Candidatus Babeliales bacterium]